MAAQFGRPLVKAVAAVAGLTSLAVAVPRLIRRSQAQQPAGTSADGPAVVEAKWPDDGSGLVAGPGPAVVEAKWPNDGSGAVAGPKPDHWPYDGSGAVPGPKPE